MSIYDISIHDSSSTKQDLRAKSLSFFAYHDVVNIESTVIDEIRTLGLNEGKNVRLLVHNSPEEIIHEMIIFQHHHQYFPPKKFKHKMKSFFIIEGALAVFVFDEDGRVLDSTILFKRESLMYRIAPNHYHVDIPASRHSIHLECTNGPFTDNSDAIFPDWAPARGDNKELRAFQDKIFGELRIDEKYLLQR